MAAGLVLGDGGHCVWPLPNPAQPIKIGGAGCSGEGAGCGDPAGQSSGVISRFPYGHTTCIYAGGLFLFSFHSLIKIAHGGSSKAVLRLSSGEPTVA